MMVLNKYFCRDKTSFHVTKWSVKETLRYFRRIYHAEYPERFRGKASWSEASIPKAIDRRKRKCLGECGLCGTDI